jgi:demethylmenaquinone methyltransferase / 2-methoxy-6-polyprenyl-1,4-benzoquinol methylase
MNQKRNKVKNIFDSIAFRYDLLNHLLSFGFDIYWRKKAIRLTKMNSDSKLLDVACGTGDVSITAFKTGIKNIIGADFSINMLQLFEKKSPWIKGKCMQMTAEELPLKDNSVTNITVAFGVRNFYDIQKGFDSFYRVLCSNGKATILEFRLPENILFKNLYKFYFRRVLPLVGGIISGSKEAYKYLPESVKEFDEKVDMPSHLKKSGFINIEQHNLTLGIVQVIIAHKV